MIGRKQSSGQREWEEALRVIRAGRYPAARLDHLIDKAADEVRRVTAGKKVAFAWSGGKDSIALEYVMRQAGVLDCVMGMCNLEYPAFLEWVTANMPIGLTVINTGQDLEWLAAHPGMLFPQEAATAAKWFKAIQHTAQARYYAKHRLDMIVLGRRKADGNYLGANGQNVYTSKGVTRYSPLGDWTHIDVLALVELKAGANWPPIYSWPRGFQVGTHAWAARQWCGSIQNGWREVNHIDPAIVRTAADYIPSARKFLER
jgi:3'-phosphoadenosine 5'-phosphosulfate sulfotransferase (PAPS reductase)/FAD synthetase